jgi:superfamily II DNA or RNA helicase
MSLKLRPWQESAKNKALNWFLHEKLDKRFLINAAPGSGKTICAAVIANKLIELEEIERVIIIAPRKEIVKQWKEEFRTITSRSMIVVTGRNDDVGLDLCATWNSIQNNTMLFADICNNFKTLVICDEHHHAAVNAVWGSGAEKAFAQSKYVIVLTGTPIRTDGSEPVWFSYSSDGGKLTHPQEGTYSLTYGEAVDLKYCRPIFFHRHEGKFKVRLKEDDNELLVSGTDGVQVSENNLNKSLIKSLEKSFDFYTLARSPQYLSDGKTPDLNSYQSTMIEWGIKKLTITKNRLPNAGGLIIAPNIKVAEYMAKILEKLTNEKPIIVHSKTPNTEDRIEAFRYSKKDWLVSVAMISEGVDIKRLRVLIYLPNPQTELAFRQAVGRVVRNHDREDDSRAYVIMPTHNIFEEYARRVEREMQGKHLKLTDKEVNYKKCPICSTENILKALDCSHCGYIFPTNEEKKKACKKCGHLNSIYLNECENCNSGFGIEYDLTLNNALRMGGIAREMDVDEDDVTNAERYYEDIRKEIIASGDARVIEVLSLFPEESLYKLKKILNKVGDD